jgi:HD-GYP domain-containing protein (c-di-GMP phosphodiesterase class II)
MSAKKDGFSKSHPRNLSMVLRRNNKQRSRLAGFYQQFFNFLQENIVILDSDARIQFVNLAFLNLAGKQDINEFSGKYFNTLISGAFITIFQDFLGLMQARMDVVGPIEIELCLDPATRLVMQAILSPIKFNGKNFTFITLRDVSEWNVAQDRLVSAHMELEQSYSITLEGWGRALELRDHESDGHTRRVAQVAVDLAIDLGLNVEQIRHIRSGALIHDIGKIAIPDSILLKPGPLTAQEMNVMKRHPVYAYELLKPIPYLQQALVIPYNHHEKWDGTGYPLGLKGEDIPLPARLFTVVDVWDALLFDRPYRKGWPESRVLAYLRDNAGIFFDPHIVEVFCTKTRRGKY